MAKIKDPKKQYDEIVERNRKEKERVLRQLEAEGITEKSAAEVLQEFTQNGFPLTLEGILRMLAPLKARYGFPTIGSSVYPDPPSPVPPDWKKLGMRFRFEFPNGQSISVVIANDGKTVIKRFYEDNGDIHLRDVIKTLTAWQKSIEQQQHGGRKNDPELFGLFQEWQIGKFDPKQKAILRKRYTDTQQDKTLASIQFNEALRRYKRKNKSLTSE
jgi:hypothetical protein